MLFRSTLLPADKQSEAWAKVLQDIGNGNKITAAAVQKVVEDMLAEGKAVQHRKPMKIRWCDRDALVKDLQQFCERHALQIPERVWKFLRNY